VWRDPPWIEAGASIRGIVGKNLRQLKDCHAETNFVQLNRSTIPIRRRPFGAAAYRHSQRLRL
jgi:hypothetical protein